MIDLFIQSDVSMTLDQIIDGDISNTMDNVLLENNFLDVHIGVQGFGRNLCRPVDQSYILNTMDNMLIDNNLVDIYIGVQRIDGNLCRPVAQWDSSNANNSILTTVNEDSFDNNLADIQVYDGSTQGYINATSNHISDASSTQCLHLQ